MAVGPGQTFLQWELQRDGFINETHRSIVQLAESISARLPDFGSFADKIRKPKGAPGQFFREFDKQKTAKPASQPQPSKAAPASVLTPPIDSGEFQTPIREESKQEKVNDPFHTSVPNQLERLYNSNVKILRELMRINKHFSDAEKKEKDSALDQVENTTELERISRKGSKNQGAGKVGKASAKGGFLSGFLGAILGGLGSVVLGPMASLVLASIGSAGLADLLYRGKDSFIMKYIFPFLGKILGFIGSEIMNALNETTALIANYVDDHMPDWLKKGGSSAVEVMDRAMGRTNPDQEHQRKVQAEKIKIMEQKGLIEKIDESNQVQSMMRNSQVERIEQKPEFKKMIKNITKEAETNVLNSERQTLNSINTMIEGPQKGPLSSNMQVSNSSAPGVTMTQSMAANQSFAVSPTVSEPQSRLSRQTRTPRKTSRGVGDGIENSPYVDLIVETAKRYGIPAKYALAVAQVESGGNPNAQSPTGPQGLMQLTAKTAKSLGVTDRFDPVQNVEGGVKLLKQLNVKYHGDWQKTLTAYNQGEPVVDRNIKKHGNLNLSDPSLTKEARNYAGLVMAKLPKMESLSSNALPAQNTTIKNLQVAQNTSQEMGAAMSYAPVQINAPKVINNNMAQTNSGSRSRPSGAAGTSNLPAAVKANLPS